MSNLYDILKELLNFVELQITQSGFEDKEIADTYEWLQNELHNKNSEDIQSINNKRFHPGKIHLFKYDPITKDRLRYWDQNPIVLSLGRVAGDTSGLEYGFNISWWPLKARKYFLEAIEKLHNNSYSEAKKQAKTAIEQDKIILDLYLLKQKLDQHGLSFALRSYYPKRIIGGLYVVSYHKWDKISSLEVQGNYPRIVGGQSLASIYFEYENHVKNYRRNPNRYLKKAEENSKKGRYNFIK